MPSRRLQYFAYIFFFIGLCFYLYSFLSNRWYRVDYNDTLQGSFLDVKHYSEGLISVCWFGDCVYLGLVMHHDALNNIYVPRLLMLIGIWMLLIDFLITLYKIHFTPDWWNSKLLLYFLSFIDVVAGLVITSSTFHYLLYHELSAKRIGYFDYGCYAAWLSGTFFVSYGLLSLLFVGTIPGVAAPTSAVAPYISHPKDSDFSYSHSDEVDKDMPIPVFSNKSVFM